MILITPQSYKNLETLIADKKVIIEPSPAYALNYPGNGYEQHNHNLGLSIGKEIITKIRSKMDYTVHTMFDELTSGRGGKIGNDKYDLHHQYLNTPHITQLQIARWNADKKINEINPYDDTVIINRDLTNERALHTLESDFVEKAYEIVEFLLQKNMLEPTHSGKGANLKGYPNVNILNSQDEPSCPLLDTCFNLNKIVKGFKSNTDQSMFLNIQPENFVGEQKNMLIILETLRYLRFIDISNDFVYHLLTYKTQPQKTGGEKIQINNRKSLGQNLSNLK